MIQRAEHNTGTSPIFPPPEGRIRNDSIIALILIFGAGTLPLYINWVVLFTKIHNDFALALATFGVVITVAFEMAEVHVESQHLDGAKAPPASRVKEWRVRSMYALFISVLIAYAVQDTSSRHEVRTNMSCEPERYQKHDTPSRLTVFKCVFIP